MSKHILEIVAQRGKMHNPITGSGGVLIGAIEQLDEAFATKHGLTKGDTIVSLTSLSWLPLYLERTMARQVEMHIGNGYMPDQGTIALTSLGLDGEAVDALTGLAKPRYVPQPGVLVATTVDLLRQAEQEGMQVERLAQLAGRTALGPVVLARVLRPGRIVIAGPALLRDLRSALDRMQQYGTRLGIVDGAINRLGAASPSITGACILCTRASLAATPELVARRTADILARLTVHPSRWKDAYRQRYPQARLLVFPAASDSDESAELFRGAAQPAAGAQWIVARMLTHQQPVFLLRGAFTEELSLALLAQLSRNTLPTQAEIVVGDGTKIFCHSVVLQRLAARGLHLRVAEPVRILALSINPYTPEYTCTRSAY